MNRRYPCVRFIQNHIRQISFNSPFAVRQSHYDSLQLSSKATQADIKDAYYRLSMLYHPDKTKINTPEAVEKFREITDAYEVLGNVRLRKMYDKGLFLDRYPTTSQDYMENKFHKSRERKSKPPPPNGRTPIYDFDEWSRSHYGATFARDMDRKQKRQQTQQQNVTDTYNMKMERVAVMVVVTTIVIFYFAQKNEDEVVVIGSNIQQVTTRKRKDI